MRQSSLHNFSKSFGPRSPSGATDSRQAQGSLGIKCRMQSFSFSLSFSSRSSSSQRCCRPGVGQTPAERPWGTRTIPGSLCWWPGCACDPALTVPEGHTGCLPQLGGNEGLQQGSPLHWVVAFEPVLVWLGASDEALVCGRHEYFIWEKLWKSCICFSEPQRKRRACGGGSVSVFIFAFPTLKSAVSGSRGGGLVAAMVFANIRPYWNYENFVAFQGLGGSFGFGLVLLIVFFQNYNQLHFMIFVNLCVF